MSMTEWKHCIHISYMIYLEKNWIHLPVTDGENSYWLIPLIIGFDTGDVPWSVGNPYLRLVGYALVDSYNGDIQLLKTGDDFFTDMFAKSV